MTTTRPTFEDFLSWLEAGRAHVCVEVLLGGVMGGDLVQLAALLVQPEPPALAVLVVIFNSACG